MTDRQITELLFVDDGPEPADLALVLGCAEAILSESRARHAAGLHASGFTTRLLLSGGGIRAGRIGSEADLMRRVVLDLGVPREAIIVEDRSRNTFENVANSIAMLRDRDLLGSIRSILLVSCPWHMRRVLLIARADLPDHIRLRCCPHGDSGTARCWISSPSCRDRVDAEASLLLALIQAGILPDPMLGCSRKINPAG